MMQLIKNKFRAIFPLILTLYCLVTVSCYSVFSGGTGGLVVDAESTSVPKAGIANVDVYAYMSSSSRDSDFNDWSEGTVFTPDSSYYGHTTTGADGSFTISKLVWKESKPDFGKDADYATVYLLFYHENYGLTKGSSVIISDSLSDTVYVELTAVRKSTVLNLTFEDVTSGLPTDNSVYAKVQVPQTTDTIKDAAPKIYEATITQSGAITISYPRYKSEADKAAQKENEPDVQITYYQSGDDITWQGCKDGGESKTDYSFIAKNGVSTVTKTVRNQYFSVTLYGKQTKIPVPVVSGQYGSDDASSDGLQVELKSGDAVFGAVTTRPQVIGNNGDEVHGRFSGLGSGAFWTDTTYTEKYTSIPAEIIVTERDGSQKPGKAITLRSDERNVYVSLP
ncbi:MAG: hypothetical protein J1E07_07250 [Treponema sp.]|nr:hypothetical protein [Treponema sp.]